MTAEARVGRRMEQWGWPSRYDETYRPDRPDITEYDRTGPRPTSRSRSP